GRARENVDRHLIVLVFVRRIAPFEAVRREAVALAQDCHAGGDRRECIARGDMDLAAATGGLGMLLEGWLEGRCAEMHALAPEAMEAWRERLAIEPRRADQLERPRGAPSFR